MYANNCDGVNLKHNKAFLFFFSCSFDLLLLIAVQLELVFFFLFFFFVLRNAFCLSSHRFVCFADQTLFTISMPRRVENIQSNAELTWGHRQEILPDLNGLGLVHAGTHGMAYARLRSGIQEWLTKKKLAGPGTQIREVVQVHNLFR